MKKKKVVKSLIVVAAIVAILGIGAISFAAWKNNATTVNSGISDDANTGNIALSVGFVVANPDPDKETQDPVSLTWEQTGKVLMPVDQATLGTNGVKMLSAKLPEYQLPENNYSFTLTMDGATLDIYYMVAATAPELPTYANENGDNDTVAGALEGWTKVGSKKTVTNSTAQSVADNATSLYIVLVSNSTAHMNKTFTVTLTLADEAA